MRGEALGTHAIWTLGESSGLRNMGGVSAALGTTCAPASNTGITRSKPVWVCLVRRTTARPLES